MNLINTNQLSSNQYHEVKRLIALCKEFDRTSGISFLDANMNALPEFPCFFLCYERNILVGVLTTFLPSSTECEVYAYTHPDYRHRGIFQKIWKLTKQRLHNYGIHDICFVMDPKCQSGIRILVTMGAYLHNSEYMLEFSGSPEPHPRKALILTSFRKGTTTYYSAFLPNTSDALNVLNTTNTSNISDMDEESHKQCTQKDTQSNMQNNVYKNEGILVGTCCVDNSYGSSSIYNFEILENYRGKKWGTEFLLLLLKDLTESGNSKILLHVSSSNKAAYHLYLHHGFTMHTQIDYWKL